MGAHVKERQKVLIVDDERFNINVLVDLLKPDYKVMVAISGKQALKAARAESPPDLVLLDIMMPEMDGYEVCRRLKADEATRDIPVIFITAMGQEEDETKGLELGAVDYLTKPISPPIVEARVRTQLALKRHLEELREAYAIIESQKERMQEELNVGRDIQLSMVPRTFPVKETFSVCAALEPAREVGGDFYDVFELDGDRLCVCVGDVSGKGVPAALFMAMAKTLIKSRAQNDASPAGVLTHVNEELNRDNDACMFVTIWLGIVDLRTGRLTYTNAGHNPPYLCRHAGDVERCADIHGPFVAAMQGVVYDEGGLDLLRGDQLLLYTDGVTEALDPGGDFYLESRLANVIRESGAAGIEERLRVILEDVRRFQAEAEQADDITLLALEYRGSGGPPR